MPERMWRECGTCDRGPTTGVRKPISTNAVRFVASTAWA